MDSTPKSRLNTSWKQSADEKKSRLTPCRRVGLKRKSVTPTSSSTTPSRKYLRTSTCNSSDSPIESVVSPEESEDLCPYQQDAIKIEEKCNMAQNLGSRKKCEKENKSQCTMAEKQLSAEEIFKLARKWKAACQDALRDLLNEYHQRGEKGTMGELLNTLRIPFDIVSYSEDEEDFME